MRHYIKYLQKEGVLAYPLYGCHQIAFQGNICVFSSSKQHTVLGQNKHSQAQYIFSNVRLLNFLSITKVYTENLWKEISLCTLRRAYYFQLWITQSLSYRLQNAKIHVGSEKVTSQIFPETWCDRENVNIETNSNAKEMENGGERQKQRNKRQRDFVYKNKYLTLCKIKDKEI